MTAEEPVPAVEQIGIWLWRQPLIPIALVGTIAACLAYSVREADWVAAHTNYVDAVWLGVLCGAALSRSRFRSLTALAYTLCLSLLGAGEWVGGILRYLWLPHTDVLWTMSVRLEALLLRLRSWGAAVANHGTIHDTGFFVFLSVVILWNVGAWLVWTVVRRRKVWEGLLPAVALLSVNIHLSGQKPLWLGVCLTAGCLLAAYASYASLQLDWDKRQVDYPTEVKVTWGASAAIIACVVAMVVQAALLLGTPAGWRAIGDFWRAAQKQTSDVAASLFSDVNPPRINTPAAPQPGGATALAVGGSVSTPLAVSVAAAAFPPNLQLIGDVPDQSAGIVMWVQTSDPPPLPPEVTDRARSAPPPQHYWRTGLFATYTGTGWEPLDFAAPAASETLGPEVYPAGRYRLRQHFEILATHADSLFAANFPVTATAGAQVRYSPLGETATLIGTLSNYEVLSWVTDATIPQLKSAGVDYPPEIAATYLQLPAALPQRVRALADRIAAAAATPYDKAVLVQEYLRTNMVYNLKVPPPPAGQDAVDYFLFEAPGGFCSYYASAMAVMLRAEGVPARVATGYAMGTFDFRRAAYGVPGSAAHAWVEVYFPAYGWVEFEPTVVRSEFARSDAPAPLPMVPSSELPVANTQWVATVGFGLAGLGALFVVMALVRAYRGLEPGWHTRRGRARALYRQMRNALARVDLHAPEDLTPSEFMAAHTAPLANYPALAQALAEATRLYLRATFSVHPPDLAEIGHARRLWLRAGGDWLRLWGRAAHRRLRRVWSPQKLGRSHGARRPRA
jgi:transglutaminase-like putative cysteine protease